MEKSVLWKLSYGMYAIGTLDGKRPAGCIVNTAIQITSENPVIAISMNKKQFHAVRHRKDTALYRFDPFRANFPKCHR